MFSSPREVNCAGNYVIGTEQIEMFPPPLEVTRVFTNSMLTTEDNPFKFPYPLKGNWRFLRKNKQWYDLKLQMFPSPPELNGGAYHIITLLRLLVESVSVPSRGE